MILLSSLLLSTIFAAADAASAADAATVASAGASVLSAASIDTTSELNRMRTLLVDSAIRSLGAEGDDGNDLNISDDVLGIDGSLNLSVLAQILKALGFPEDTTPSEHFKPLGDFWNRYVTSRESMLREVGDLRRQVGVLTEQLREANSRLPVVDLAETSSQTATKPRVEDSSTTTPKSTDETEAVRAVRAEIESLRAGLEAAKPTAKASWRGKIAKAEAKLAELLKQQK